MHELFTIRTKLSREELLPMYIFIGNEPLMIDKFIEEISKIAKSSISRYDSVSDAFPNLSQTSLLTPKRVFLVSEDVKFLKEKSGWESVKKSLKENILILLYNSTTLPDGFMKFFDSFIVKPHRWQPSRLYEHIHTKVPMSMQHAERLTSICDCNYSRIMLELDKLQAYLTAGGDIPTFLDGLYIAPKDHKFQFIGAMLKCDIPSIFRYLEEMKALDVKPLDILSLLYSYFRCLLIVKNVTKAARTEERTGLTAKQISFVEPRINEYSTTELIKSLQIIQKVESGIKSGWIGESIALDYVIVNIVGMKV